MAANEVSRAMTDGGGCSPHMWHGAMVVHYARNTVVLAANEVSEVGAMMMGVAAHHSPAPMPHTWQGRCLFTMCIHCHLGCEFLVGVLLG